MNRILFHAIIVTTLAFGFVACQKKKDSKKSPIGASPNSSPAAKPEAEKDAWLQTLVKMTEETSHVYREVLVRVVRDQDTNHDPQTILKLTNQALQKFASGQDIVKNQSGWESEIQVDSMKKKMKFYLKRPQQRGDRFYQLSVARSQADEHMELVSFELKAEKEVSMSVRTSNFSDLVEKGLAVVMHSNFKCDFKLESSQSGSLMSEVACEKMPFVQTTDKVIVAEKFNYTRNNEGEVEMSGDVYTVGTKTDRIQLKIAHVGKISVVVENLIEPVKTPSLPAADQNANAGTAGVVNSNLNEAVPADLEGEPDPSTMPRSNSQRSREINPQTGQLVPRGSSGENDPVIRDQLNEAQSIAQPPGSRTEMESMPEGGVMEAPAKMSREDISKQMADMMAEAGIDPNSSEETQDQSDEEGQQAQQVQEASQQNDPRFPPPFDSDLQGAPQQRN